LVGWWVGPRERDCYMEPMASNDVPKPQFVEATEVGTTTTTTRACVCVCVGVASFFGAAVRLLLRWRFTEITWSNDGT
jgi:hypothetical protein